MRDTTKPCRAVFPLSVASLVNVFRAASWFCISLCCIPPLFLNLCLVAHCREFQFSLASPQNWYRALSGPWIGLCVPRHTLHAAPLAQLQNSGNGGRQSRVAQVGGADSLMLDINESIRHCRLSYISYTRSGAEIKQAEIVQDFLGFAFRIPEPPWVQENRRRGVNEEVMRADHHAEVSDRTYPQAVTIRVRSPLRLREWLERFRQVSRNPC